MQGLFHIGCILQTGIGEHKVSVRHAVYAKYIPDLSLDVFVYFTSHKLTRRPPYHNNGKYTYTVMDKSIDVANKCVL